MRLVDSSGGSVIEGNPGFTWSYQELMTLSALAVDAKGPVGREILRDPFVPPSGITPQPVLGRTVQACLVTGAVLSNSPYQLVGYFSEGLAAVYDPATKRRGFVNTAGKLAFPARLQASYSFFEGLASVAEEDGKLGAIDTTGKFVLAPQ